MAAEEIDIPLMLRKARTAVFNKEYDEAAVLYTTVMAQKEMAANFDVKVRHAFCVEKTGHVNQAIKLYQGIVKHYREVGEDSAAEGVEYTIAELEKKLKEEAEAKAAAAAAAKAAAEKEAAEKARLAQAHIDKLRAEKAAAEKAAAAKAAAEIAEQERLRLEQAREEHAREEAARREEILRKKSEAEKARAKRANAGKVVKTAAPESYDLTDIEGSEEGDKLFDGSDTVQINLLK